MNEIGDEGNGDILRVVGEEPARSLEAAETLDSVMHAPALERVARLGEQRRLHAEAMAPVMKLVEGDAAAVAAAKKLREQPRDFPATARKPRLLGGGRDSLLVDLAPGLKILGTPYDFARTGPVHGGGASASADPGTGFVQAFIGDDEDYGGGMVASGAVGLSIVPTKSGTVSVRPYLKHSYDWMLFAHFLSASIEGRIGFFVEEQNGPRVSNTQEAVLFHQTSETFAQGGIETEPFTFDGDVHFAAHSGRRYTAWFWATLSGDQSGGVTFLSWSHALGNVKMQLLFLGVELT